MTERTHTAHLATDNDIAALAWVQLGHVPRDRLVLLPLPRGGGAHAGPGLASIHVDEPLTDAMPVVAALTDDQTQLAAIVYAGESPETDHCAALGRVVDACRQLDVPLITVLRVDGDTWWRVRVAPAQVLGSPGGLAQPVSSWATSGVYSALAPVYGQPLPPDANPLGAVCLPREPASVREAFMAQAEAASKLAHPGVVRAAWKQWERAHAGCDVVGPEFAAALRVCALRDACMVSSGSGGLAAARALLDAPDTSGAAGVIGEVFSPNSGPPGPNAQACERAWAGLAAVSQGYPQAVAYTQLAWLQWWGGHGPRARLLVQRAWEVLPPGDSISLLESVQKVLDHVIAPGWAQQRDSDGGPGCHDETRLAS